jgi:hypothetical protein
MVVCIVPQCTACDIDSSVKKLTKKEIILVVDIVSQCRLEILTAALYNSQADIVNSR